ncbi:hypothetical protein GIB67_012522 [Kingdonia uniflora]|uniref:Cytochrome P450 n=1 Tax=Kingdonia uniflora TaxID=39325 RepID=A0A7J7ML77_9MAGN|nr:hypothetical protein GIB67_012522 [Kingdonia uniflora]
MEKLQLSLISRKLHSFRHHPCNTLNDPHCRLRHQPWTSKLEKCTTWAQRMANIWLPSILTNRLHEDLFHLTKTHGPLFSLCMGQKPVIVVSSPEVAREFLKDNDSIFSSRMISDVARCIAYDALRLYLYPTVQGGGCYDDKDEDGLKKFSKFDIKGLIADMFVAGIDTTPSTIEWGGMSRDLKIWTDPHVFKPERFIGNNMDVKGHDFEILPFCAGRRSCVGMPLGLRMVQYTVASILHAFEWDFPADVLEDTTERVGVTVQKAKTLIGVPKARLPNFVYQ